MARLLRWLVACNSMVFALGIGMLGPCDFVFKNIDDCDGTTSKVAFEVLQKRYNRSISVFDIQIRAPYEVGDHLTVELKGSLKKEGGYKPGAFYLKDTLCKVLDLLVGDILDDILTAAGVDGCPLPPGNHSAKNFYFDNTKFNVPQLFGEYKMEIFVFSDETTIDSCYVAYYELVPKAK